MLEKSFNAFILSLYTSKSYQKVPSCINLKILLSRFCHTPWPLCTDGWFFFVSNRRPVFHFPLKMSHFFPNKPAQNYMKLIRNFWLRMKPLNYLDCYCILQPSKKYFVTKSVSIFTGNPGGEKMKSHVDLILSKMTWQFNPFMNLESNYSTKDLKFELLKSKISCKSSDGVGEKYCLRDRYLNFWRLKYFFNLLAQ